jgi:hypothetical protein
LTVLKIDRSFARAGARSFFWTAGVNARIARRGKQAVVKRTRVSSACLSMPTMRKS